MTLYSSKHHVGVDTLDGYPQSLVAPPNTPFISSNRGPGIERHIVVADSLRERIHIVVFINIIGFRSFAGRYWHLVWLVYYSLLTLLLAHVLSMLLLPVYKDCAWVVTLGENCRVAVLAQRFMAQRPKFFHGSRVQKVTCSCLPSNNKVLIIETADRKHDHFPSCTCCRSSKTCTSSCAF